MKHILLFLCISSCMLTSCSSGDSILNHDNYAMYLEANSTIAEADDLIESDRLFWSKKLATSPGNSVYLQQMAMVQERAFKQNHSLDELLQAQESLERLHVLQPNDVGLLHQLISNSITRHAFNDARAYALKACEIGENKYTSQLTLVDIMLEQGQVADARDLLEQLGPADRFERQVRYVKILDAEGDLDAAIEVMEAALALARSSNKKSLVSWSLSNLGDMYGHQGEIQKSYSTYLEALALDPQDAHSLQGIGWIALSHDRNPEEADRIWSALAERSSNPELLLLRAEAARMSGDDNQADSLVTTFIAQVSHSDYGNMYGSYLIDELAEVKSDRALQLAEADLEQRQHPVVYSRYALSLHHNGMTNEALDILSKHVLGATEEPDAYYISAIIYDEAGLKESASLCLKESLAAAYELGPIAERDIKKRLSSL